MPEANFNLMNLNQRCFVNLDQIYSVMNLGDVDVEVELIVSKRKKKAVIEINLQQKQEIKKQQEKKNFIHILF